MSNCKKDWIYLLLAKNKDFWRKKIVGQNIFGQQKFGSNISFRQKKILVKKIRQKKVLVKKKFGQK